MKTNKKQLSAVEKFQIDMQKTFTEYYSKQLSENVKRGLRVKKERDNKAINN